MYREIDPPADLAPWVQSFWTIRSEDDGTAPRTELVLPDGCSDLIFNFGDPPGPGMGERRYLRSYVVGTMTRALKVPLQGRVDLLGARFRPGAAAALVAVAAAELTDRAVPLADLWGDQEFLAERLADSAPDRRAGTLAHVLERQARASVDRLDSRVQRATALIDSHRGRVRVRDLAGVAGVSVRQLERLFARHVGTSPKLACRVARLQRATTLLRASSALPLARVAAATGYHDQPHMTRDFVDLAGVSPGRYRGLGA